MAEKTKKQLKGIKKTKPDVENPEENPMLKVENKDNFNIQTGNLIQDTELLIFTGYESFDIKKEGNPFDSSKLSENSSIIITLRYYEYVCIAKFTLSYIIPLLESGLGMRDIFDMIRHCLRNKLIMNAPTFDSIFDIDMVYKGYVHY